MSIVELNALLETLAKFIENKAETPIEAAEIVRNQRRNKNKTLPPRPRVSKVLTHHTQSKSLVMLQIYYTILQDFLQVLFYLQGVF